MASITMEIANTLNSSRELLSGRKLVSSWALWKLGRVGPKSPHPPATTLSPTISELHLPRGRRTWQLTRLSRHLRHRYVGHLWHLWHHPRLAQERARLMAFVPGTIQNWNIEKPWCKVCFSLKNSCQSPSLRQS